MQALARLVPNHGDRIKLARRLKCQPNQITQWLGGIRPNGRNRTTIRRKLKIQEHWWDLRVAAKEKA